MTKAKRYSASEVILGSGNRDVAVLAVLGSYLSRSTYCLTFTIIAYLDKYVLSIKNLLYVSIPCYELMGCFSTFVLCFKYKRKNLISHIF